MATGIHSIKANKIDTGKNKPYGIGLSIFPAIVYGELLIQKLLADCSTGTQMAVMGLWILAYAAATYIPYLCILIAIGNTILYIGLMWALIDNIDYLFIRVIMKCLDLMVCVLIELGICINIMIRKRI